MQMFRVVKNAPHFAVMRSKLAPNSFFSEIFQMLQSKQFASGWRARKPRKSRGIGP
jgi:hypothetical protein